MSRLWTVYSEPDYLWIKDPDSDTRVVIDNPLNISFARALCHVLNSTPLHKLRRTIEEMDQRGVPEVK